MPLSTQVIYLVCAEEFASTYPCRAFEYNEDAQDFKVELENYHKEKLPRYPDDGASSEEWNTYWTNLRKWKDEHPVGPEAASDLVQDSKFVVQPVEYHFVGAAT